MQRRTSEVHNKHLRCRERESCWLTRGNEKFLKFRNSSDDVRALDTVQSPVTGCSLFVFIWNWFYFSASFETLLFFKPVVCCVISVWYCQWLVTNMFYDNKNDFPQWLCVRVVWQAANTLINLLLNRCRHLAFNVEELQEIAFLLQVCQRSSNWLFWFLLLRFVLKLQLQFEFEHIQSDFIVPSHSASLCWTFFHRSLSLFTSWNRVPPLLLFCINVLIS